MQYCRFNDGRLGDKSTVSTWRTYKDTWEIHRNSSFDIITTTTLEEFRDKLLELRTQGEIVPDRVFTQIEAEIQRPNNRQSKLDWIVWFPN